MTTITTFLPTKLDLKFLFVEVYIKNSKNFKINGKILEDFYNIPCLNPETQIWKPIVDIDQGQIINWESNGALSVYSKVTDTGNYILANSGQKIIAEIINGYVPDMMSPGGQGYRDYIIMNIDKTGKIIDWFVDEDNILDQFDFRSP